MSITILYAAASLALLVFAVRFDLWRRRRKWAKRRAQRGGYISLSPFDDQADPREWLR